MEGPGFRLEANPAMLQSVCILFLLPFLCVAPQDSAVSASPREDLPEILLETDFSTVPDRATALRVATAVFEHFTGLSFEDHVSGVEYVPGSRMPEGVAGFFEHESQTIVMPELAKRWVGPTEAAGWWELLFHEIGHARPHSHLRELAPLYEAIGLEDPHRIPLVASILGSTSALEPGRREAVIDLVRMDRLFVELEAVAFSFFVQSRLAGIPGFPRETFRSVTFAEPILSAERLEPTRSGRWVDLSDPYYRVRLVHLALLARRDFDFGRVYEDVRTGDPAELAREVLRAYEFADERTDQPSGLREIPFRSFNLEEPGSRGRSECLERAGGLFHIVVRYLGRAWDEDELPEGLSRSESACVALEDLEGLILADLAAFARGEIGVEQAAGARPGPGHVDVLRDRDFQVYVREVLRVYSDRQSGIEAGARALIEFSENNGDNPFVRHMYRDACALFSSSRPRSCVRVIERYLERFPRGRAHGAPASVTPPADERFDMTFAKARAEAEGMEDFRAAVRSLDRALQEYDRDSLQAATARREARGDRLLRQDIRVIRARLYRAVILGRARARRAVESLQEVWDDRVGEGTVWWALVQVHLAYALEQAGREGPARQLYREVLEHEPAIPLDPTISRALVRDMRRAFAGRRPPLPDIVPVRLFAEWRVGALEKGSPDPAVPYL